MNSTRRGGWVHIICRAVVIACAGVVSLSCSPSREGRGDSAGASTNARGVDSGRTVATSASAPAPMRHSGELPRPIEDMIKKPGELTNLIGSMQWTERTRRRNCRKCAATQFTRVRIGAAKDAHTVNYDTLPRYGVLMARMENLDTATEAKYGIPPKETWYVLWGGTGTPPAVARLVQRTISQSYDTAYAIVPNFSPPISDCKDGHKPKTADADFKSCPKNAADTTQTAVLSASEGVWVSCSQGCCTSDTGPLHGPKR